MAVALEKVKGRYNGQSWVARMGNLAEKMDS